MVLRLRALRSSKRTRSLRLPRRRVTTSLPAPPRRGSSPLLSEVVTMAKYYGKIGSGVISEVRPGVYEESITERYAYGDILRNSRKANTTDSVNADLTVGNHISIVADAYASTHFFAMRYIEWAGALWYVQSVEVK